MDKYTVEINPKKPRTSVIVDNTRRSTVEILEKGFAGPLGPTGPRGAGIVAGLGVPTSDIGGDGDIYFDTQSGDYYGPKADGLWPLEPITAAGRTRREIINQPVASSTWNLTHGLGGRPSVTIVDSAGTTVIGEVVYNSDTSITVLFSAPFSGQAYLT
jgi:hypothetical protein